MSKDEVGLTNRERECVLAYGELGTIDAVAARFSLSANTVRNHLYSARTKLGVRFTVEAVWMVRRMKAS